MITKFIILLREYYCHFTGASVGVSHPLPTPPPPPPLIQGLEQQNGTLDFPFDLKGTVTLKSYNAT